MRKAALLLPVCLALAGCGGYSSSNGNNGATTAAAPAAGHVVSISESEYKLSPSTVSIAKTGKVTFDVKNMGKIEHALEIEGNGVQEETEHIAPGAAASITVTLSKNGTYEMYCPIDGHRDKGMQGTIRVGGSAGGMTTEGTTTEGTTTGGGYGY
jgi:plastocyanin